MQEKIHLLVEIMFENQACSSNVLTRFYSNYRTRAIITRGLYIFYSIYISAVYIVERLILQKIYVLEGEEKRSALGQISK